MLQSLPAYPQPSIDYQYVLGYIPYPTWSYPCRNSQEYSLYEATDKILFEDSKKSVVIALSAVIACGLVLVVLFRLFYVIRHIVDLKSRSSYNALMLTEDEIVEQMPNLDIKKSFKKECILFTIELLLILGMAGTIIYALIVLTK